MALILVTTHPVRQPPPYSNSRFYHGRMSDDRSPVEERAEGGELGDFDELLEKQDYPVTDSELISTYGDREVESMDGTQSIEEVLRSADEKTYDSADEVRDDVLNHLNREE
jgi:hypothetical protein